MRTIWMYILLVLLLAGLAAAQTATPGTQNSPASQPAPSTSPSDPSGSVPPAQPMPPDTPAPPAQPNAPSPQSTTQDQPSQQTQPVLGSRAQTEPTTTSERRVNANTEMRATLDTPLSTKTSRVGDRFTATVAQPVRGSDGNIAIPAGAKIHGEITEAEKGKVLGSVRGEKGRLNMRFREISLPSGETMPLTATLVSLNQTKGSKTQSAGAQTSEEGEVTDRTTGKEVAKNVGIGAGIGTVAGLIFGSALKGLAIGAIAGGGYVLATQGRDVNLPADTGMVLRTDRSISVPANTGGR